MNFTVNNEEYSQVHLYTVLIQGINTFFTDGMPTIHVLTTVHPMLALKFLPAYAPQVLK